MRWLACLLRRVAAWLDPPPQEKHMPQVCLDPQDAHFAEPIVESIMMPDYSSSNLITHEFGVYR